MNWRHTEDHRRAVREYTEREVAAARGHGFVMGIMFILAIQAGAAAVVGLMYWMGSAPR